MTRLLIVLAVAVTACHATPPVRATPPEAPAQPVALPAETGECTAHATQTVAVAMRPRSDELFGQISPGDTVSIAARSKDGWLGFDPGVAQAANVGPFRLKWIDPAKVTTEGDCARMPPIWTPEPHTCFEMGMEDVPLRSAPRADAPVVVVLHFGEFAALTEVSGTWLKADLARGNTSSRVAGWIAESDVNASGDGCEKL